MLPDQMLKEANAAHDKRGLYLYLESIWALRRMGNSYRDIAKFLTERGVETDHTAVFRLLEEDKPDLNYRDGLILIGGLPYESRKGRPLKPFGAGLIIYIEKKLQILPQNSNELESMIWCEAQFELNEFPNHCWLKQLSRYLGLDWNHATPWHLQGKYGIELKFNGKLMAMVCQKTNLEKAVIEVATAIDNTTQFFVKDKDWASQLHRLLSDRREKIFKNLDLSPSESVEEAYDEYEIKTKQEIEALTKRFESCLMR